MKRQCTAIVESTGERCRRPSVNGADVCAGHGGAKTTKTPENMRKRIDRPGVKCHATKANSGGVPCGRYALKGTTVCSVHGGKAGQVQRKARERLTEMVDPAVVQLNRIITKEDTTDTDRLRAIQMLLDRTGYGPRSEMVLTPKPWEALVEGDGLLIGIDYGPPIVGEIVRDKMQAALDQAAYEAIPNAEVIPIREHHPVMAVKDVPAHLRG